MITPGLCIDCRGQVNHTLAHKLPDAELLDVCQLAGPPLPENLGREIERRKLQPQLADLLERQRLAPNH